MVQKPIKERLQELDSYELRTAMLWGWLFAFCVFAFVVSVNVTVMDFAQFPIALFAIFSLFEGLRWLRRLKYRDYYAWKEAQEAEGEIATEENPPITETITPVITQQISDEEMKKRANFYAFVFTVCRQRIVGQGKWEQRGLDENTYKEWMKILKRAGVIYIEKPGATPQIVLDFDTALERIAEVGGNPDYWKPVKNYYAPAGTSNTLLLLQDR